ncbi:uncharacterized protein LOC125122424 [Phacochoerus africanus]|uniref:uncharacterized protein LOC125122424 n=1 Tax=Phacochoerus africanus TaxID=41426 RepID=UPI001FD8F392|nr:uncharacterized protein LOC125122424 [Phacochoerus africanus]
MPSVKTLPPPQPDAPGECGFRVQSSGKANMYSHNCALHYEPRAVGMCFWRRPPPSCRNLLGKLEAALDPSQPSHTLLLWPLTPPATLHPVPCGPSAPGFLLRSLCVWRVKAATKVHSGSGDKLDLHMRMRHPSQNPMLIPDLLSRGTDRQKASAHVSANGAKGCAGQKTVWRTGKGRSASPFCREASGLEAAASRPGQAALGSPGGAAGIYFKGQGAPPPFGGGAGFNETMRSAHYV